jgi:hypothetical protein
MKNKLIASAIALIGFAATSNAQVSASANVEATIVTPIGITKNVDLVFGNVAVGASAGTVVLNHDGTRTKEGGVTLPVTTGTVTAAKFTVVGVDGYTYSITLPTAPVTITRQSGTETMTVNEFVSSVGATGTLTGGSEIVTVGGTLNVAANQVAGTYTKTDGLSVTVNYN